MTSFESSMAPADKKKSNRRRTYFVNPKFQWKYTLTIAVTVFLTTAALSSVLYMILHEQARMRFMQPNSYTTSVTSVVLISALVFSAVTATALGIWCIIATHRICGPLFVLQRYMSQLAAGQLPTLRPLRRKDEFKELYAVCSRAIESLRATREAELTLIGQADEAVQHGLRGDDDARKDALDTVATHLDILRKGAATALDRDLGHTTKESAEAPMPSAKEPAGVA